MSALLNDTTVVYDKYLIGMADCFKAVSNNNYCLVARKSLDSFLQTVLIYGSPFAVASSRITLGAFFSIALAIEILCFSPPERLLPPSPITVS